MTAERPTERPSSSGKQWTRAELAKISPEKFVKNEAEIMAQMRAGKIR